MTSNEIRPNKTAFMTFRYWKGFFVLLLILLIASLVLAFVSPGWIVAAVLLFIVWNIFRYFSLRARYKKERYIFMGDKIIRKGGSLFSDVEQELVVRNTTHVKCTLPYLQNN